MKVIQVIIYILIILLILNSSKQAFHNNIIAYVLILTLICSNFENKTIIKISMLLIIFIALVYIFNNKEQFMNISNVLKKYKFNSELNEEFDNNDFSDTEYDESLKKLKKKLTIADDDIDFNSLYVPKNYDDSKNNPKDGYYMVSPKYWNKYPRPPICISEKKCEPCPTYSTDTYGHVE
jgi:hypothetical protein